MPQISSEVPPIEHKNTLIDLMDRLRVNVRYHYRGGWTEFIPSDYAQNLENREKRINIIEHALVPFSKSKCRFIEEAIKRLKSEDTRNTTSFDRNTIIDQFKETSMSDKEIKEIGDAMRTLAAIMNGGAKYKPEQDTIVAMIQLAHCASTQQRDEFPQLRDKILAKIEEDRDRNGLHSIPPDSIRYKYNSETIPALVAKVMRPYLRYYAQDTERFVDENNRYSFAFKDLREALAVVDQQTSSLMADVQTWQISEDPKQFIADNGSMYRTVSSNKLRTPPIRDMRPYVHKSQDELFAWAGIDLATNLRYMNRSTIYDEDFSELVRRSIVKIFGILCKGKAQFQSRGDMPVFDLADIEVVIEAFSRYSNNNISKKMSESQKARGNLSIAIALQDLLTKVKAKDPSSPDIRKIEAAMMIAFTYFYEDPNNVDNVLLKATRDEEKLPLERQITSNPPTSDTSN